MQQFSFARVGLFAALTISLLVAVAFGYAQGVAAQPKLPFMKVLSGEDIGVAITAQDGDKVIGQVVVRIDGRWVTVNLAGTARVVPAH